MSKMQKIVAQPVSQLPTEKEVLRIPLAKAGEYELTDAEVKKLRPRIYGLNKNNAANRRWRTMREGSLLLVWRIR